MGLTVSKSIYRNKNNNNNFLYQPGNPHTFKDIQFSSPPELNVISINMLLK